MWCYIDQFLNVSQQVGITLDVLKMIIVVIVDTVMVMHDDGIRTLIGKNAIHFKTVPIPIEKEKKLLLLQRANRRMEPGNAEP